MRRKNINFIQEEKESEEFMKKLKSSTSQRKKESSVLYHKFELLKYYQELNDQQKHLEEDLSQILKDKFLKSLQDESAQLKGERYEYRNGIYKELDGFSQLVKDLQSSHKFFQELTAEGRSKEAKAEWKNRVNKISEFSKALKQDLIEREEYLYDGVSEESLLIADEFNMDEDSFIDNLPQDLPGLNIVEISEAYKDASQKLNDFFNFQLSQLTDMRDKWDEDSSNRFYSIHKQYIQRGKPRERYMERLLLEFPKMQRNELEKHDKVVENIRWNKNHRKNIIKDWNRHKLALKQSAEQILDKLIDDTVLKFNKEIEFIKQEKQQKRIHQELNRKIPDYLQRIEEKKKQDKALELKQIEEEKKKESERAFNAAISKKNTLEYKQNKQTLAELERKRISEENLKNKIKQSDVIKKNLPKVRVRQELQDQKIVDRIETNKTKALEKEKEKDRISKAISMYQHMPKVEIDTDRVKQNTKSKDAKKNTFDLGDKANLYQQTGFTVDNLMKDMRYKLSHALNEAGLQGSEYGKRILQAAPHAAPRKDTIETHDFKQI